MTPPASPSATRLVWYGRRLRQMSAAEVGWRVGDRLRQEAWARRHPAPPAGAKRSGPGVPVRTRGAPSSAPGRRAVPAFPPGIDLRNAGEKGRTALLDAAEEVVAGRFELLGCVRTDMADPTWALDPTSGQVFPVDRSAFRIGYRDQTDPRSVKHVWELSRLQHLTVLAAAWRVSGNERYALTVDRHLRSWWAHNPVLCGVNWASGIELGIRLISWVWVRRLLDGWEGTPSLFEDNDVFASQLYWHQRFLATFPSRGSSANNHLIAEAAGQLTASCAFPWFGESRRWQEGSATLLQRALERNTFPEGVNREQAFEYHGFVAELGLVAAAEAEAAGTPLDAPAWARLCQMVDVVAATLDRAGRAPRYGDGDDGRALVVTAPTADRWRSLLAVGAAVFGAPSWWPETSPDMQSILIGGLVQRVVHDRGRPGTRPWHFPNAGLTILRSPADSVDEIWCRCDGGPHGFLSIGAHGHADALSIELRSNGVELLSDPGTYRYQGNRQWREYFRSTIAHNTVEVDGQDQSTAGGPFLWTNQAQARTIDVWAAGHVQCWAAEHDGYCRLESPVRHRRTVTLDTAQGCIVVDDRLESDRPHRLRLAYHLGPGVEVDLRENRAELTWDEPGGRQRRGSIALPGAMRWGVHRGSVDPALGWYSPRFGVKVPASTLVGEARIGTVTLRTEVRVVPASDTRVRGQGPPRETCSTTS